MDRLTRVEWEKLDDLLGRHGFGGYYDLVECLKTVAGDLGISEAGVDLYPSASGDKSMSLPHVVQYLQNWTKLLTGVKGFSEMAKSAASDSYVKKGLRH